MGPLYDLLVGVNGTGKSTLLRSLALIFQSLECGQVPAFGFEIIYELNSEQNPFTVVVRNINPENGEPLPRGQLYWKEQKGTEISDDSEEPDNSLHDENNFPSDYLPERIVAFTSGSEKGWQWEEASLRNTDQVNSTFTLPGLNATDLKEQLQNLFIHEVPGRPVRLEAAKNATISDRFLFISSDLIPLVVLCGLLNDMSRSLASLQKVLRASQIKALRGFSLKLRMNNELLEEGPEKAFTEALKEQAHHIVQTGSDYLLVFALKSDAATVSPLPIDAETKSAQDLIDALGDGLNLFQKLVELAKPKDDSDPILRDVHLFLERDRKSPEDKEIPQQNRASLYLFNWLSDGEQSFLGRLCLFPMLNKEETLVLLDEPEVHFNDYWKRRLIFTLSQALTHGKSSHVIMTTHSSITLSDVGEHDIWVLKRENDNRSSATRPPLKTFGTDPSDILVYIFGAEESIGAYSVDYIRTKLKDIANMPSGQEKRKELERLRDSIGPSYWRYLVRREILEEENAQNNVSQP